MTNFYRSLINNWLDVVAILCLGVLPSLCKSAFALLASESLPGWSLDQLLVSLIVRSLQVAVPILLIMHLRNVRWKDYGFVKMRLVKDIAIAAGLMALSYFAFYAVLIGLAFLQQDYSGDANPFGAMSANALYPLLTIILIFVASAANGFTEELTMRGYLIPRLANLTGSNAVAVILTSFLFASYHFYQGRYGFISALLIGLVLGIYFVRAKRFWPIAIAHMFMDVVPLLIIAFPPE